MGVLATYFIALALSAKTKKSISNTAPLSIMALILVEYIFANAGFMKQGIYAVLAITIACVIYCVFAAIKDIKSIHSLVISPASIAYILYIVLFCFLNLGRGFVDSDDMLVWGLNIKNMCYYDVIDSELFTNINTYPRGTMMWEYIANKTWLGFSEGVTLWAYDVYTASLMLPLYDYIRKEDKIAKFFCVFGASFILPFMTYEGVFSRLCANSLAALLVFWGFYNAYMYYCNREKINFISILLTVSVLPLTIRAGVLLVFGIIAFTSFGLFELRDKYRIISSFCMILSCSLSYASFAMSVRGQKPIIGIVVSIAAVIFGITVHILVRNWSKLKTKSWVELIVAASFLFSVVAMVYIRDHANRGGEVVETFFRLMFTTQEGSVIHVLPITICTCIVGFCFSLFSYYQYLTKHNKLDEIHSKQLFLGIFLLINVCEFLFACLWAYAFNIGLEPGMRRLPSFNRYLTPCLLVPLLFIILVLLKEQSDKKGIKLYLAIAIGAVLLVDCSKPINWALNKYQQPEYYAFDDAGVELQSGDKVFYINLHDESGKFTEVSFYYQMMPAMSNYTRAYAGTADLSISGQEEDTSEFGQQLVDLGYNYVYIQTINDAFAEGYKQYFEDGEIITGAAYKVTNGDQGVKFVRLGA